MKKGLFNRRIPTILALFVLIAALGVSTLLVQSGIFYVGKAAPDGQPQNFSLTNITDTSFTVVFTTTGLSEAVIKMNNADTGNAIILDDRDKRTGVKNKYFSHHVTAHNLKANSTYSFNLISAGKEYTDPTYSARTGQIISSPPPNQKPIFGKILLPSGEAGADTIVVAKTNLSGMISAVTDGKGEFILPTNSIRNIANSEYITLINETTFTITAYMQTMKASATATFLAAQNLPPITLLQQYVFVPENETPTVTTSRLSLPQSKVDNKTITISVPQPQETFTDIRPGFTGTAPVGNTINLIVKGVFSKQVLTNPNGAWSFRPDTDFLPGRYILTATTSDKSGTIIEVSSQFAILPQGSQVLADQLNPTTTITPTPTQIPPSPTPTATSTPTPTQALSTPTLTPVQSGATPTLTSTPTPVQSGTTPTTLPTVQPTLFITPTKIPSITPPGGTENSIILTSFSVILIIAGIAILFAL